MSDHYPITVSIPAANLNTSTKTIDFRKLKNVDLIELKADLYKSLESVSIEKSFESTYLKYEKLSQNVMDKNALIISKKQRISEPPWMDEEYRRGRALRRKTEREWKKYKTEEYRLKYIEQKKDLYRNDYF